MKAHLFNVPHPKYVNKYWYHKLTTVSLIIKDIIKTAGLARSLAGDYKEAKSIASLMLMHARTLIQVWLC